MSRNTAPQDRPSVWAICAFVTSLMLAIGSLGLLARDLLVM